MTGPLAGVGPDELREAVRAVLREVFPAGTVADHASVATPPRQGDVVIATDTDLTAFVRRIAALCEDPHTRAELQGGRHGFRLASTSASAAGSRPAAGATTDQVTTIERGAVTERAVIRAARAGGRLRLGRAAVLTPLARDKARSLGVEIEKER